MEEQRARGLPSIEEARRQRRLGRWPRIPGRFWLWAITILAAWGIVYWKVTQGQVESAKAKIFGKQRGVLAELGPRFDPLRDRLEAWTVEAAGAWAGDVVDPAARTWDFGAAPGVYLRLRLEDARSVDRIRKAASRSLRDAFTGCLLHEPNADPAAGTACRTSGDCAPGTFCNEFDRCTRASQPYNLRTAYRGTRVLTDDWTVELRAADNDLRVRLLERDFDGVVRNDIPLVIDLLTRAQFFLLVLDEDPPEGAPRPGAGETAEQAVQGVAHPARVALWSTKAQAGVPDGKLLVRLRREPRAKLVPTFADPAGGEAAAADPAILAAQQRNANSCALALAVRAAIAGE